MNTWEMVKFWFIRETMPLLIVLGIVMLCILGCFVWAGIETLRAKFRKRPNTSGEGREV